MLYFRAILIVQGKATSDITQFGCGVSSSINFSAGFCSIEAALKSFGAKPREGSKSKFSHPSGNPASSYGNLTRSRWILSPVSLSRVRTDSKRAALCGVVTMV
ncbi:hypothetical protein PanWU01x14_367110, partial [Parasponia andersonii]